MWSKFTFHVETRGARRYCDVCRFEHYIDLDEPLITPRTSTLEQIHSNKPVASKGFSPPEIHPSHNSMAAVDVGTRTDTIGNGQYDDAVEDFYRDLDIPGPEQNPSYNGPILEPAVKDIDEEIKITKKRKPIAKLDADRYARCTLVIVLLTSQIVIGEGSS